MGVAQQRRCAYEHMEAAWGRRLNDQRGSGGAGLQAEVVCGCCCVQRHSVERSTWAGHAGPVPPTRSRREHYLGHAAPPRPARPTPPCPSNPTLPVQPRPAVYHPSRAAPRPCQVSDALGDKCWDKLAESTVFIVGKAGVAEVEED